MSTRIHVFVKIPATTQVRTITCDLQPQNTSEAYSPPTSTQLNTTTGYKNHTSSTWRQLAASLHDKQMQIKQNAHMQ